MVRRQLLINPPQDGQSRVVVFRLDSTMHVDNAEWPLGKLRANFVKDILFQPLRTYNWSCGLLLT